MSYELTYKLIDNDTHYEITGYTGQPVNLIIPNEYEGKAVTSIGAEAFRDCSSLISVVISDNINIINNKAFLNCKLLKNIVIGNGVKTISSYAFRGCSNLNSINLLVITPADIATYTFDDINTIKAKFYCYRNSFKLYKNANVWANYIDKFIADDTRLAFILNANAQKQYFASKEEVTKSLENKLEENNIATINGQSITSGGNIEIQAGLSIEDIATNEDIDAILGGSNYIDELKTQADQIIDEQENLIGGE